MTTSPAHSPPRYLAAPETALWRRSARLLDVAETTRRLRAHVEAHGPPLGYDIFGTRFSLGDDELGFVIDRADGDTFLVARSERAYLLGVSIHQSASDAIRDFIGRLDGPPPTRAVLAALEARLHAEPTR